MTKDRWPVLLLLFELDVDDVLGFALGAAVGRAPAIGRAGVRPGSRAAGGPAGLTGTVKVLGHRLAGPLELVDRPVDGVDVVALLDLVDLVHGRTQGRLVRL